VCWLREAPGADVRLIVILAVIDAGHVPPIFKLLAMDDRRVGEHPRPVHNDRTNASVH
jgi:hypothetical protein